MRGLFTHRACTLLAFLVGYFLFFAEVYVDISFSFFAFHDTAVMSFLLLLF